MDKYFISLINDYKGGDNKALLIIVSKFTPLLKKLSRRLDYEDSESDLIIFLIELISSIDLNKLNIDNDGAIVNYIKKSLINKQIDIFRKNSRNKITFVEFNNELHSKEYNFCVDEDIYINDYLLNKLTKSQREIITYSLIKGLSDLEISKKLNTSRQSVNKTKKRALENLKNFYTNNLGVV